MGMPSNVVEGVELMYGGYLPAHRRSIECGGIYSYHYRTVNFVTAVSPGDDFLVDVAKRVSAAVLEEHCNAAVINSVDCTLAPEGWSVAVTFSIHRLTPTEYEDVVETSNSHPVIQTGYKGPNSIIVLTGDNWEL